MKAFQLNLTLVAACLLIACNTSTNIDQHSTAIKAPTAKQTNEIWPQIISEVTQAPVIEQKVDELLNKMTLAQKVAQMIQPEIRDITR